MHKIVTLPGDGIGPEIMASALEILQAATAGTDFTYEVTEMPFGGAGIDAKGHPFPEETQAALQTADAILLGAIGGPQWHDASVTPEQGLLQMRALLGLYANVRPVRLADSLVHLSPLKEERVKGTDMVIVRELIGGIYFGKPKYREGDEAFDTMYYNRGMIERIARYAFELAQTRRGHVTSVDKANVLANSRLWRETVNEVAQDYPDVQVEHLYVDAAAMKLITKPTAFDVILTENLFGDILSDEASVIPGSLGLLPSASISAEQAALYEPIHGSAPDIAGQALANPMSMILSVMMMLRQSFGEEALADRIEEACQAVMAEGIFTKDLGGQASTTDFTQAVIRKLQEG